MECITSKKVAGAFGPLEGGILSQVHLDVGRRSSSVLNSCELLVLMW